MKTHRKTIQKLTTPAALATTIWGCRMRTTATLALGVSLAVGSVAGPGGAWAFSQNNHEIVGHVATKHLEQTAPGRRALARVRQVLGSESLGQAARWADDVKGHDTPAALGRLPAGHDAAVFLNKVRAYYTANPDALSGEAGGQTLKGHRPWHYVNLPFQKEEYHLGETGTRRDDLVQMLRHCVLRLRDGSSPGAPIEMTQKEALRLLAHYAGDIHQPVHVGSGYVLERGGRFDFVVPSGDQNDFHRPRSDRGGNDLVFGSQNLHAFWDGTAPDRARRNRPLLAYAQDLVDNVPPAASWSSSGDVGTWSKQWADDTLRDAQRAYEGIDIVSVRTDPDRPQSIKWNIQRPAGYNARSGEAARVQLAKAGFRFARLLIALWGAGR